jgi:hypothetical protein
MTTPRSHNVVSLALALTLTLGACVGTTPRPVAERPAPTDGRALSIRFDNEAGEFVQVYLVGARREWRLGRVEAGARATLRIPDEALDEREGWTRLVVLAGQRGTVRAADAPRAALTMAQPTAAMLTQRWTFTRSVAAGQITGLPLGRARREAGHQ